MNFRSCLSGIVVMGLVLIGAGLTAMANRSAPGISFQAPEAQTIRFTTPEVVRLNNPDPAMIYIAESGSHVVITRPISDKERTRTVLVIAKAGSHVEATGTNISVTAEPGSVATVSDGVSIDAKGAEVFVVGDSYVKAFEGAVVHNSGSGEVHAYKGSVIRTQARGRTFAEEGSTVYAKSPENCDACTQVAAAPGSTVYVWEGAEAFAKAATVTVYKGGEVGCSRKCTLFLYPGAEFNYGAGTIVTNMPEDSPEIPFEP